MFDLTEKMPAGSKCPTCGGESLEKIKHPLGDTYSVICCNSCKFRSSYRKYVSNLPKS